MAPTERAIQIKGGIEPTNPRVNLAEAEVLASGEVCMHRWLVLNSSAVHICTRTANHTGNHKCKCANIVLDDSAHVPERAED